MNTNEGVKSELMNRREAAQFLRLNPGTLANWHSTGRYKIPALKLGKRVFYRKHELEQWLETRRVNPIECN